MTDLPLSAGHGENWPAVISPTELEYHVKLIERARWAQQARQEIATAEAAFKSWGEHLHAKYELGPRDGVDESGRIVRPNGEAYHEGRA